MASFEIDRQTLKDLDLFNEDGSSIYSFFNHTQTIGGTKKLKELMETPSFDASILNSRRDTAKYFYEKQLSLSLVKKDVDFIEYYLVLNVTALRSNAAEALIWNTKNVFKPGREEYVITEGIKCIYKLLKILNDFNNTLSFQDCPGSVAEFKKTLSDFLSKKAIQEFISKGVRKEMRYLEFSYYDSLFRKTELTSLQILLKLVYELDAYTAIAKAVTDHGFCFPEYDETQQAYVEITGLYHPCITKPISNNVHISSDKNLFFLTGANMAGKSSFLKALGSAVYLAHVGFPVPAAKMRNSIFKGLITTINLSDNINNGYSHYYSEVIRVKKTAQKILENDNLFVIFDELFRGTNVKDAYDASLATIQALAKIPNSVFLVSTHIVEIADELKSISNVVFKYFDSKIDKDKPVFDYQLRDGVSSETLGYYIFKNEGILEILANRAGKY